MEAQDRDAIVYPDSDGKPMSDNMLQFQWIVTLKENLDAALPDLVAGDLLWYAVEGEPKQRRAPDVLVALGRDKALRGSYKQWVEGGPPEVVMEVLSPNNTLPEMLDKLRFYERHGAREFYIIDPDNEGLQVWLRGEDGLTAIEMNGHFTSPLLGITFHRVDGTLFVTHADGTPFRTFAEIKAERDAIQAEKDALQAEKDAIQAEKDAIQAEKDAIQAEKDAIQVERDALLARLRALGIEPGPEAG